jgi:hypothetical protein
MPLFPHEAKYFAEAADAFASNSQKISPHGGIGVRRQCGLLDTTKESVMKDEMGTVEWLWFEFRRCPAGHILLSLLSSPWTWVAISGMWLGSKVGGWL